MASYKIQNIRIDDLKLDPNNYRFSYRTQLEDKVDLSDEDIIKHLNNYSNLAKLKNQIASEGWIPPNEPFVIAFGDGGYIVKEGNRRIAALKTLVQSGNVISGLVDNMVSVKVYTDLIALQKAITKIHTEGNEQWEPWAKALDDLKQNKKTENAHLLSFILSNKIKEILDADCYTILIESLKKSQEIFNIIFSDQEFNYETLGIKNTVYLIKDLIRRYKNKEIDTRNRDAIGNALSEIKQKFSKQAPHDPAGASPNLFIRGEAEHGTESNGKSGEEANPNVPRRKYPTSISEETFKEWIDQLRSKYTTQTRSNVSFLLLKDIRDINKLYINEKLMLCRSIWDALLYEYSHEKRGDKVSIELKSESICGKYTEKLKSDFPDIKDIAKQAQNYIGLLNDIVHGVQYKREPADLYSCLTDLYPLLSFLVDLINNNVSSEKSD